MGVGVHQHICRSVSSGSLNGLHIAAGDHQLISRTGMPQTCLLYTSVFGPKGLAVRQLKRYASWVQNVVRQFGPYQMCIRDSKETGGAWLSSARVVRCWVKSRNERNPYCQLLRKRTLAGLPDVYKRQITLRAKGLAPASVWLLPVIYFTHSYRPA